jgi:hypothetical protein
MIIRAAGHLDAGHAPLQGVDEILATRFGDILARDGLLRCAKIAL